MEKRILVTDDHAIVRKGIVSLLKEHFPFFHIDEAGDAAETVKLLRQHAYQLLILDLNLPDANVEKLVHRVRMASATVPVIVFSAFPEAVMTRTLQQFGIRQFINKACNPMKLKEAVEKVLINPGGRSRASLLGQELGVRPNNPFAQLSPKEMLVMFALLEGRSNREIRDELDLSASTVATYKQRIFEKLSIRSTVELTRLTLAFDIHYLRPSDSGLAA